jgi:3-phenylpropionate/trans-cinnamate dioxygenase ferredoxin subunit
MSSGSSNTVSGSSDVSNTGQGDGTWVKVADLSECPPGSLLDVEAGRESVVLANIDGDLYALENRCSHQDLPLSDGELDGDRLECLYHGARFDVCTGKAVGLPAIKPVTTYVVELRGQEIYVQI